ncbi:TetR/AcrR family transcriptional regulator [Gordonia soli]|uniref:Putative TetR family transcriptional regulator n=1 Tax=Gordonia soli NBRC 108243 TaxID=1223545 RepID=M0QDI0_9ACTN|nr:TetR/AcrR family transcriptional regulator [Gordonia soli]GAC66494.1 putative TetR family transcriptional regulator [Gordonia soli NBRC 108243]
MPADPTTPKGAATRARLLAVAADVFAEKGYAATSFSELIASSGLTKGAFYFYFPSKAALAAAVIEDQERRWTDSVRERVTGHDSPTEQLADVMPAMLDLLAERPGAWSAIRLTRELAGTDVLPDPRETRVEPWISLLVGIIRAGQHAGRMRADLDAEEIARVLVAAFDGIKASVDATAPDRRHAELERYTRVLELLALGGLISADPSVPPQHPTETGSTDHQE